MTRADEITGYEYTPQEVSKRSKLAWGLTVAKALLRNPGALKKLMVMGPDEPRYVKAPLRYALPLLFIDTLVFVSISGCTSPSSTSTATSTTTPAGITNNIDALLASIMKQMPTPNENNVTSWGAQPLIPGQVSRVLFSYGDYDAVDMSHFNTVANATVQYNKLVQNYVNQGFKSETTVYFGLSYYTTAVGHATTVKNARTFYVGGDYRNHETFVQYDNVTMEYTHSEVPDTTT